MSEWRGRYDNSRVAYYLSRTITNENGCMIWQGNKNNKGYAQAERHGDPFLVHRYIAFAPYSDEKRYELWNDPTVNVMHLCDVKDCENPAHLRIANASINRQDAFDKGLQHSPHGEAIVECIS